MTKCSRLIHKCSSLLMFHSCCSLQHIKMQKDICFSSPISLMAIVTQLNKFLHQSSCQLKLLPKRQHTCIDIEKRQLYTGQNGENKSWLNLKIYPPFQQIFVFLKFESRITMHRGPVVVHYCVKSVCVFFVYNEKLSIKK